MAQAAQSDGDRPMSVQIVQAKIPEDILKDSVLAHVAAAYFAVGKRLERRTRCSATRGFILSALRHGAALIAVVHSLFEVRHAEGRAS